MNAIETAASLCESAATLLKEQKNPSSKTLDMIFKECVGPAGALIKGSIALLDNGAYKVFDAPKEQQPALFDDNRIAELAPRIEAAFNELNKDKGITAKITAVKGRKVAS